MDTTLGVIAMRVAAGVGLLVLAACATMPTQTGSLCPVGPFIGDPGASSRLTRAEKEYVVTLNQAGEKVCGWTAPGGTK